jgi:hypothetical protein
MLVGPRHFDSTMVAQYERYFTEGEAPEETESSQGFIDQWGVFMDRFEALAIATAANQVREKTYPKDRLFSEDLY